MDSERDRVQAQRLPVTKKGIDDRRAAYPERLTFFRSFLPRTTRGPRETLFLCHRRSDRKGPRIPHPDVAQQIRKNPDLVIQGQRIGINPEVDAATPNAKRYVVPASGERFCVGDFRRTLRVAKFCPGRH